MKSTTACTDAGRVTVRDCLQLYAKKVVDSLDLVVLAVCDSHRLKSSNHTSHCYVVGGWETVGAAKTSTKLNSDLTKCDYLEWVCIRFVCKYGINH